MLLAIKFNIRPALKGFCTGLELIIKIVNWVLKITFSFDFAQLIKNWQSIARGVTSTY